MAASHAKGVELEYATIGDGEPVLFVHGGVFADWFAPLVGEPALAGHYRLIAYHRVSLAGSSHPDGPVSVA
jgi:pimeloyl-ACP methyl ester carboxylesterase